jgi:hypothetical protein
MQAKDVPMEPPEKVTELAIEELVTELARFLQCPKIGTTSCTTRIYDGYDMK